MIRVTIDATDLAALRPKILHWCPEAAHLPSDAFERAVCDALADGAVRTANGLKVKDSLCEQSFRAAANRRCVTVVVSEPDLVECEFCLAIIRRDQAIRAADGTDEWCCSAGVGHRRDEVQAAREREVAGVA